MTIKKFKLFLVPNVKKEEEWLTEMSQKGFHFKKYRWGMYYFDENPQQSFIYQIDFRESDEEYVQLLKDAGWEYMDSYINRFHYFRTDANRPGVKRIYSDRESVKASYQRMMSFYLLFFILLLVSQTGLVITWKGYLTQKIVTGIVMGVILLYIYLIISLKRKIDYYRK